MVYDPVSRQMLDEGLCARVRAGDGWVLLRAPEGHWIAHRPWTGATRGLEGQAEAALVRGFALRERLLARCAVLAPREGEVELEETAAAALLQKAPPEVRGAVTACRDTGFSAGLVEWALRTVDVEASDEELFEGVRIVRLGALLGADLVPIRELGPTSASLVPATSDAIEESALMLPVGFTALRMNVSHRTRRKVLDAVGDDGVPVRMWGGAVGILDAYEGLIVKSDRVPGLRAEFGKALSVPRGVEEFGLWMGDKSESQRRWLVQHGVLK